MAFKVRCKLVAFMGDVERFPCHFGYEVGEEFIYDGEKFIGRVCSGVIPGMASTIVPIHFGGNKYGERILFRYAGYSKPDPKMKKHDGQGWAPVKVALKGSEKGFKVHHVKPATERQKGWEFACQDVRTAALFVAEPFDLADGGNAAPFYKREISIFKKIKKEPGIGLQEILNRFSDWEREEIWPPLTPMNMEMMLDELEQVNYIEIRNGKAYPKRS